MDAAVDNWIEAVLDRHTAELLNAEFVRAIRALSARYVERRADLPSRSPIDSAGKRAAFAAFYAPLHLLTTRAAIAALGADAPLDSVTDVGCGTGVCGAAWALSLAARPQLLGIDQQGWSLSEAAWNWRQLGCRGRTKRADMVDALDDTMRRRTPLVRAGLILGWSANELPRDDRAIVLEHVLAWHARGGRVLVLEPLATSAVPWWPEWAAAVTTAGGRADEWKFDAVLPHRLAALDQAAGFRRDTLGVRTLWLP